MYRHFVYSFCHVSSQNLQKMRIYFTNVCMHINTIKKKYYQTINLKLQMIICNIKQNAENRFITTFCISTRKQKLQGNMLICKWVRSFNYCRNSQLFETFHTNQTMENSFQFCIIYIPTNSSIFCHQ